MGEPISAADALIQQVVSEAEMLTLASAGLLFVRPLTILRQLANGRESLLRLLGEEVTSMQPRCEPGHLPTTSYPDVADRRAFARRFHQDFATVPRPQRFPRIAWNPPTRLVVQMLQLDRCVWCRNRLGSSAWHMEHRRSHEAGGDNSLANIQAMCIPCHLLKDRLCKSGSEIEIGQAAGPMGYDAMGTEGAFPRVFAL